MTSPLYSKNCCSWSNLTHSVSSIVHMFENKKHLGRILDEQVAMRDWGLGFYQNDRFVLVPSHPDMQSSCQSGYNYSMFILHPCIFCHWLQAQISYSLPYSVFRVATWQLKFSPFVFTICHLRPVNGYKGMRLLERGGECKS